MKYLNQKGNFSVMLLGAIMACALTYFLFKAVSNRSDVAIIDDDSSYMDELRAKIETSLQDSNSIDLTLSKNPNVFSCLYSSDGDCNGVHGTFILMDASDKFAISQLGRKQGISSKKIGCNSFPSRDCPYKVEAEWSPVCAGLACLKTNSFNVKVKLIYDANMPNRDPLIWETSKLLSPSIQLSASAQCSRDGGVWDGVGCNSGGQTREVASESVNSENAPPPNAVVSNTIINEENLPICQDRIELQGQSWILNRISASRAELKMPAVNGCPAEDLFVFQCTGKNPPDYNNEGQWVQVEASMASPCDEYGNPIQPEAGR